MPDENYSALLSSARSFCNAFASQAPLPEILSLFSDVSEGNIIVHEHGLPQLAPFLGRDFYGIDGVKEYFSLISSCLSYKNMTFLEYVVDTEMDKVSARGKARFTWTETGQSWDETFVYMLRFDGEGKVVRYEIWADSGAAYLARKGLLESEK